MTISNFKPRGKFIVIEGLEGAGKSTAIAQVKNILESYNLQYITTREPGGTILAEKMREIVKTPCANEKLTDISELLLMYAARSQLVANVIQPAIDKGIWVIGDRHDLSSHAYQGGGRQLDQTTLAQLKELVLQKFTPDFTLYMDIEPALGLSRAKKRGSLDRIEQMDLSFFNRTRERYLQLVKADSSIVKIDANLTLPEVQLQISNKLELWLNNNIGA